MSAHIEDYGISYFSVPKIACTSLKLMFFEAENGFEFREFRANSRPCHIHNAAYPSVPFQMTRQARIKDHWKVTVVRDPIERVLSAYSNRVLHHGELDNVQLTGGDRAIGMTRRPDLETFFEHMDRYRQRSESIAHHTDPMVDYLGTDASYYDRIYRLDEIPQMVADVSERVGRTLEIGWFQRGGPKISPTDLSERMREKLRAFFADDYDVYGGYLDDGQREMQSVS